MRPSIKQSLMGLLMVGALAFSATGAAAMGGDNANGPDAGIGIIGGLQQPYGHSAGGSYQGGGFQAYPSRGRQNGYGRYGTYNGGYYRGY